MVNDFLTPQSETLSESPAGTVSDICPKRAGHPVNGWASRIFTLISRPLGAV